MGLRSFSFKHFRSLNSEILQARASISSLRQKNPTILQFLVWIAGNAYIRVDISQVTLIYALPSINNAHVYIYLLRATFELSSLFNARLGRNLVPSYEAKEPSTLLEINFNHFSVKIDIMPKGFSALSPFIYLPCADHRMPIPHHTTKMAKTMHISNLFKYEWSTFHIKKIKKYFDIFGSSTLLLKTR